MKSLAHQLVSSKVNRAVIEYSYGKLKGSDTHALHHCCVGLSFISPLTSSCVQFTSVLSILEVEQLAQKDWHSLTGNKL